MVISKKKRIWAIVIALLIIAALIGGYFLYKNYNNKKLNDTLIRGYGLGYNQSLREIAKGQAQTGSIVIWQNNSIQIVSIQDICAGKV